jgi:acetyltransferase-like isoleucine patch superfamily enzyme
MILLRKLFRIIPFGINVYYKNWNKIKFKIYGVKFGSNFRVYNKIYLTFGRRAELTIGDNFTFTSGGGINPISRNKRGQIFIVSGAKISVGNNSGISSSCLWAKEKITIGNYVNIGADCIIMDTDAHNLDWQIRAGLLRDVKNRIIEDSTSAKSAPVTIEDYAFIGTRSIILKGVTIGARSIIAAGSVVSRSIPPDCIAGGNPCKVIKQINQP